MTKVQTFIVVLLTFFLLSYAQEAVLDEIESVAQEIEEYAQLLNLQPLADGYAKDSWYGYFQGKRIDGASGSSFETLGGGYAKDTWNVFFHGNKVHGAG